MNALNMVDEQTIKLIEKSFDSDFYAFFTQKSELSGNPGIAFRDYLESVGKYPVDPNAKFSESTYLEEYPDVREAIKNGAFFCGFHHFILHGQTEGRRAESSKLQPQYSANQKPSPSTDAIAPPIAEGLGETSEKGQVATNSEKRTALAGRREHLKIIGSALLMRGWAWTPTTDSAEGAVLLLEDAGNNYAYPIRNAELRKDVARAGFGNGHCGFELMHLVSGDIEKIKFEFRDEANSIHIPHRPKEIEVSTPSIAINANDKSTRITLVDTEEKISLSRLHICVDGVHSIPCADLVFTEEACELGEIATKKYSVQISQIDQHLAARRPIIQLHSPGVHVIDLREGRHILATCPFELSGVKRGNVDSVGEKGAVRGWAVIDNNPSAAVSLVLGSDLYEMTSANRQRDDLIRKGLVTEGGGFEFSLPLRSPTKNHTLPIRILNGGEEIASKQATITFNFGATTAIRSRPAVNFVAPKVTVVIAVYNAPDEVEDCINSVIAGTYGEAEVLIVDDCSPDERITPLLAKYSKYKNIRIEKNKVNIGYTKTINKAVKMCKGTDVVLLNSDTIVPDGWLNRLILAAYSQPNVATVTPLSTNAGAFSVPELGKINPVPFGMKFQEMARAIQQGSLPTYPEVPTGNGFCLYIRADALAKIGTFDEVAFPRGYGEENDFCMRAMKLDMLNLMDDRTYVYHKRSASFGTEKGTNYASGQQALHAKYPEYRKLTPIFSQDARIKAIRWRARTALTRAFSEIQRPRPRVLYVISTQTGGTPQTNRDLMGSLSGIYEPWLLRCDSTKVEISKFQPDGNLVIENIELSAHIRATIHDSVEYQDIVTRLLVEYDIELLHVRHLAWHGVSLTRIAHQLGIPVIYSLHDFYTVCPTIKLLDGENKYCGGVCTAGKNECKVELWPEQSIPLLRNAYISEWRLMMAKAMKYCDAFVTTDQTGHEILRNAFECLRGDNFHVIPHGRTFENLDRGFDTPSQSSPLRILVPGNISIAKGLDLIRDASIADYSSVAEFHILGDGPRPWSKRVKNHGKYQRSEFAAKASAIRPHVGAVLSIWPETYCHTLTELWATGLPVIAIDVGAVGERIKRHGGGWLLPLGASGEDVLDLVKRIRVNGDEYLEKCKEVTRWQIQIGRIYDNDAMAARYDLLYRSVFASRRSFVPAAKSKKHVPKLALVLCRSKADRAANVANASTHIRILERYKNSADRSVVYLEGDTSWITSAVPGFNFDMVVVGRGGLSDEDVAPFIKWVAKNDIPYILDRDDDLLAVPADKDPDGAYARRVELEKLLLKHAAVVTASTKELASRLSTQAKRVELIENRQSGALWREARATAGLKTIPSSFRKNGPLRVVYMGTKTHVDDLDMVAPALKYLVDKNIIRVSIIGISEVVPDWCDVVSIPDTSKNYTDFVRWLCTIANQFDVAIAPLVETDFNLAKSDLKYCDYALAGIPGIYSNVGAYGQTVLDGVTGVLVANTQEDWSQALLRIARDERLRRELAVNAFNSVSSGRVAERFELILDEVILSAIS